MGNLAPSSPCTESEQGHNPRGNSRRVLLAAPPQEHATEVRDHPSMNQRSMAQVSNPEFSEHVSLKDGCVQV